MTQLENIKLLDFLPESINKDETVKAIANAIEPSFHQLAREVDAPILWTSIDKMTSVQLDHLAVMFDLQVWRDQWPLTLKRSVLKSAFVSKRTTGTVSAVRNALASLGSASRIVEWWQTEPKGEPHTFDVVATLSQIDGTLTNEMQEDLLLMIRDSKPARSHFTFTLSIAQEGGMGFYGYARPVVVSRVSDIY